MQQPAAGWPLWLAVAAVAAPVLLLLWFVARLGLDAVVADELHYVPFVKLVREGGDWGAWVWQQHNEHRVVAMKLLFAALARFGSWNQHVEMLCSWALTAGLVAALLAIHRRAGGASLRPRELTAAELLRFAPLAWLACSVAQYENQLYGLMICHYFTAVFGVVALWLLGERAWWWMLPAAFAAVVAATSVASGLLVFPAGIAVLVAHRADWRRWLCWCITGAVTIALYFRHYIRPPHTRPFDFSLHTSYQVVKLTLATAGAPLAARSLGWALTAGALIIGLGLLLLLAWWRGDAETRARRSPAAALLLFGLVSAAMVGMGRATLLVPGDPLGSRYVTHSNLIWYGVCLLLLSAPAAAAGRRDGWRDWFGESLFGEGQTASLRHAFFGVVVVGLVASNLQGVDSAREWHRERALDQYVMQTFDRQPDNILGRLGPPDIERPRIAYLHEQRLSAFAQLPHLMMMMNPLGPVATGDIRTDLPVVQRLECPVDRLYDVGVMMLPAVNVGQQPFVITVSSGDRELGRRSFEAASITQWQWAKVPLGSTFDCYRQPLEVRIESAATVPGQQVMALTVQPYYAGELEQGGKPLPEQRLALALNGFRHFVLP